MSFVYHYTDLNGLKGIIQKDHICLWFTHFNYLNDSSEGYDFDRYYSEAVSDFLKKNKMSEEVSSALNNHVFPNRGLFFSSYWNASGDAVLKPKEKDSASYICCFSQSDDSLDMWRYYSKNSVGCAIGFDTEIILESLHVDIFSPNEEYIAKSSIVDVIYDDKNKKRLIMDVLEKNKGYFCDMNASQVHNFINSCFMDNRLSFKNNCFMSEKETRCIITIPKDLDGFDNKKTYDVEYRIGHGLLVPYISADISSKALFSITISPFASDLAVESIKEFVNSYYPRVRIKNSSLPVRF